MARVLLEGSEAIADVAIGSGCRFFAGYPMSPFTELLEHFSHKLPDADGVCINAESEIEGINMAMGAAATGARSATGSCGQGIALMQEAIAESALNELPLVVFNMARNQQDYFQATRGGGWGDYRTLTLAPKDIPEAVEHTQLLFHLADKYRAPVIFYGDHYIAQTQVAVDLTPIDFGPLPPKDWGLDGSGGGTGHSHTLWTWRLGKANDPGPGPDVHWQSLAEKFEQMAAAEARHEQLFIEGAETIVVSFGSAALFVEHVVKDLRAEGVPIGCFRPITLWPFPEKALDEATRNAKRVLVYELNAGQMIDDVRLSVFDRSSIRSIGGVSVHESGLRHGPLMDAPVVRQRILDAISQGGSA